MRNTWRRVRIPVEGPVVVGHADRCVVRVGADRDRVSGPIECDAGVLVRYGVSASLPWSVVDVPNLKWMRRAMGVCQHIIRVYLV